MQISISLNPSFPTSALHYLATALAYEPQAGETVAMLRQRRNKLAGCILELEARTGTTATALRLADEALWQEIGRQSELARGLTVKQTDPKLIRAFGRALGYAVKDENES